MTYMYSEEVCVIRYDFTVDGRTWYSEMTGIADRNKANVKWLELKADKNVRNIRTSMEFVVLEKEIRNVNDATEAFELGELSFSEFSDLYNFLAQEEMDNMPAELDPRQ